MPARLVAALCCQLMLAGVANAAVPVPVPVPVPASADTGTDASVVIDKYLQHFVVETDGSYRLTVEHAKTIARQRAIHSHSQHAIGYSASLDVLSDLVAYTRKPDGRQVAVLPEHILDQHESAYGEAPVFQDRRVKTVVFPDVQVGDQLVLRYVLQRATPLFPGHFEDLSSSQFYANAQFHLIYDMPESMPLYADAVGFRSVPGASPAGRKRYRWHYVTGHNDRIEAESVSYLDYGKRLAVSSFPDYAAFARAYDARARPMARPNRAIKKLAHKLTAGVSGARAKALLLSDWVRRNIRYVGVYVGAGTIVPHAAPSVLQNRYGDCKDHAVLLEALLEALGIDSTAALINSGSAYRLPSAPTLGIFDHVITYVPALDLYLDSTAESIAAGYLPVSLLSKPVLLARSGVLARTPHGQPAKNRTVSWFGVRKNGASTFSVEKSTAGAIAEPYRQAVRDTGQAEREHLVQRMLAGLGQTGDGVFDAGKLDENGDEYRMRFDGASDNFVELPGPTGLATTYNFWGGLGDAVFGFGREKVRTQEFICPAIDTEDETGFAFAEGVRILALPKPLSLSDANFSYRSQYERKGNTVVIKRHVRFRHHGMVCTPAEYRRMAPLVERMMRDLRSQIVVQAS